MSALVSLLALLFLSILVPFQAASYYRSAKQSLARIRAGERSGRVMTLCMIDGGMFGVCVAVVAFVAACAAAMITSGWGVVLGSVALGCAGLGLWAGIGKGQGR